MKSPPPLRLEVVKAASPPLSQGSKPPGFDFIRAAARVVNPGMPYPDGFGERGFQAADAAPSNDTAAAGYAQPQLLVRDREGRHDPVATALAEAGSTVPYVP